MEEAILKLVKEGGPRIGSEIMEAVDDDGLGLWRTCMLSGKLTIRTAGRRYLRLDRRIEGYARLSPSILREFLTYSVIGSPDHIPEILHRVHEIQSYHERVSREKSELVYRNISALMTRLESEYLINDRYCVILAGDIVYQMAHDVPRPERSTGKLVRGSDMDLIVIVDDEFPRDFMEKLDEEIFREKQRLLMTPHLREEIDYVVKDMARVREQVRFDTFRHMVACKIMREGALLYGHEDLFHTVKTLLMEQGVMDKLDALEKEAQIFRNKAEDYLLQEDIRTLRAKNLDFFYPVEESEEFE